MALCEFDRSSGRIDLVDEAGTTTDLVAWTHPGVGGGALGPVRLPTNGRLPDWLISGGESGAGARTLRPQWIRDVIADCRRFGVAPFHKQWESYDNNPLVVEKGMTAREAPAVDVEGKGGGLVDGKLVREFPDRN